MFSCCLNYSGVPDGERVPLVSGYFWDADEDPIARTELEAVGSLNNQVGHPVDN